MDLGSCPPAKFGRVLPVAADACHDAARLLRYAGRVPGASACRVSCAGGPGGGPCPDARCWSWVRSPRRFRPLVTSTTRTGPVPAVRPRARGDGPGPSRLRRPRQDRPTALAVFPGSRIQAMPEAAVGSRSTAAAYPSAASCQRTARAAAEPHDLAAPSRIPGAPVRSRRALCQQPIAASRRPGFERRSNRRERKVPGRDVSLPARYAEPLRCAVHRPAAGGYRGVQIRPVIPVTPNRVKRVTARLDRYELRPGRPGGVASTACCPRSDRGVQIRPVALPARTGRAGTRSG